MSEHTGETTRLRMPWFNGMSPNHQALAILAATLIMLIMFSCGAMTMRSAEDNVARNERVINIEGSGNTVIVTEIKPQVGLLNFGD